MTDPATIAKGLSEAQDIPDELVERVGRAIARAEGYAWDRFPYDERAIAAIRAVLDWQASNG